MRGIPVLVGFLVVPLLAAFPGAADPEVGFHFFQPGLTAFASEPALAYVYFVPATGDNPGVDIRVDEGEWQATEEIGGGYWRGVVPGLAEGAHVMHARAHAEGEADQFASEPFTLENDPPLVTIDAVGSTSLCELAFTGIADDGDGSGIYEVGLWLDGRKIGDVDYDGELADRVWTIQGDMTGFLAGDHQLVAEATDMSFNGNGAAGYDTNHAWTEVQALTLVRDCVPHVEILTPATGDVVRGEVLVSGTIDWPTSRLGRLDAYVDGWRLNVPDTDGSTWSFTWDAWREEDGNHLLEMEACSRYGDVCHRDSVEVVSDHLDAFSDAGEVTCAAVAQPIGLFKLPRQIQTDCQAEHAFASGDHLTSFRVVLEWDTGLTPDLDDLALIVSDGVDTWEERAVDGQAIEIGTFVGPLDARTWTMRVEASGKEIVDLAYEQAYRINVDFAYWWHDLPA
jgi:hypothetical protein